VTVLALGQSLARPSATRVTPTPLGARRVPTAVPICACLSIISAALLIAEVSATELLLFASFQIAYALVPGFLSYLLLARGPRSRLDALALAAPLGMAIQIGCFILAAAVGERWLFSMYPALYALAATPLLYARRRALVPSWQARRGAGVKRASALGAFAVAVATTLVVYASLFAQSPLPQHVRSASYYPDLIFNVSLASEILHHWPFMNPSVSGVALHYHIFVNVHAAASSQVTHIDLASIVLRLEPALLVAVVGIQLFALGRKLTGSSATGFAALLLGLFAGELNFSWHVLAGGGIPVLGLLLSPSYLLGAVFFLAIVSVLVDGLTAQASGTLARYGTPVRRGGAAARYAALLGILGFGAAGAKSSVVPVLLGGLSLFALGSFSLARPRASLRATRTVGIGLIVLAAIAAGGYLLIYRGGGEAVRLKPLDFVSYSGLSSVYRRAGDSPAHAVAAGLAAVAVLSALLLSLAGALLARDRWLPRREAASPERLLLCMLAASLPPFVLIAVPGDSEVYFVVYGFLAASVVSAIGITRALAALAPAPRELARPALACAGGTLAVMVALWIDRSTLALVGGYLLLGCVIALTAWLLLRRRRASKAAWRSRREAWSAAAAAVAVVLACLTVASTAFEQAAPVVQHLLRGQATFQASGTDRHRGITAEELRGLTWLRDHTPTSATIAVNNHQLGGDGGSRYVYYSAFAERRVLLESWQYTPQGAEYVAANSSASPFPRLLALNEAAVGGSPSALVLLHRRYGVDYVVIDRVHGPSSPKLASVAREAYANPAIAIFEVR
jgi:hypothetical protein